MARGFYDIRDFGAATDLANNARAIQAAISRCHEEGGGTVCVAGGQYTTGTIELLDHVTLRLERGASLLGSLCFADYPHGDGLVYANGAKNIAVTGGGALYGRRPGTRSPFPYADDPLARRPRLLCLNDCEDVTVADVSLLYPNNWCSVFVRCRDVRISGVRILSGDVGNGDGLDFNGSRGVSISHCFIDAGDDAISLKSYAPEYPVEDFVISDCVLKSHWAGIRVGVEGEGDMRNILMSNCVLRDCGDGLKIQNAGDSVFERMQFTNLVMDNVARPFFITLSTYSFARRGQGPSRPPVGKLRDLLIRDVMARYDRARDSGHHDTRSAAAILGLPGHPVEDVRLENVSLALPGGCARFDEWDALAPELLDGIDIWPELFHLREKVPASGVMVRHVDGLTMKDCRFETLAPDDKPMLFFDDVRRARLYAVEGGKNNRPATMRLDSDVRAMDGISEALGTVVPGEPLLRAHADKRREDVRWQEKLRQYGQTADAAHALPVALSFYKEEMPIARFFAEAGEGRVYAYLPMARGAAAVRVNDQLLCERLPPEAYRSWRYYWAVDITEALREGENVLAVTFAGAEAGFLQGQPSAFEPSVWQRADHFAPGDPRPTPALELRTVRPARKG